MRENDIRYRAGYAARDEERDDEENGSATIPQPGERRTSNPLKRFNQKSNQAVETNRTARGHWNRTAGRVEQQQRTSGSERAE